MMQRLFQRLALAALLASGLAGAASAESQKTFKDWSASCPDETRCNAVTVIATPGAASADYVLHFDRAAGINAPWTLGVAMSVHLMDRARPIEIRIDDNAPITLRAGTGYGPYGAVNDFYLTDPRMASVIADQMTAGMAMRISYIDVTGSPVDLDFSLSGLSASLLWIDERQDRVGDKRRVAAPAHLGPAPHVAATDIAAAGGMPPQVLDLHRTRSDCEDPHSTTLGQIEPLIAPLSGTAILYAIPCTAHAYNITYRLYVVESGEIGGTETLYFADYSDTHGWIGTDLLFNVSFDGATKTLTAFYKGRGLGDCGTSGTWQWKGHAFALKEYRAWSRCDGSHGPGDWPRVFPARP